MAKGFAQTMRGNEPWRNVWIKTNFDFQQDKSG
jgi:hypothetical protein